MTCEVNDTVYSTILEQLLSEGTAGFKSALEVLLNEAMKVERARHVGATAYQRSDERQGYCNGFKPKQFKTTLGKLSLDVPQVRDSSFYPSCLEKGSRTDRTFLLTIAEMYVQGTSTRKVSAIVEKLCGLEVSSSEVSRAVEKLDPVLSNWRNRPIGRIKYLYIDARYEKIRQDGNVIDCAVLIAAGVDDKGHRRVLGVSVSLSEHEVHWRAFFNKLQERGMHGLELITSDAHSGLKKARKAVFPSVPWQRCQFHLQQNAQSYVTKKDLKKPVAAKLRAIFNAENRVEADRLTLMAVKEYEGSQPKLAQWVEENISEGLTVFSFPEGQRKKLRTSNLLERVNREVKRRTRVATLFPNEDSCCRLVTAVLMEISEEWETGRRYIVFDGESRSEE
jgi:putative transposase